MRPNSKLEPGLRRFMEAHVPPAVGVSWQVRAVLACVHERLFDPTLSVRCLKDRCRIRDNNISCRFKREVGTSIKQYLEALRLECATALLQHPDVSVAEVAHAVGYTHLQTFYGAFTRRYRCTPGEYATTTTAARGTTGRSQREHAFSPSRLPTLAAAMECILPGGDGPGATDANAVGYVEWLCRQPSSASGMADLEAALTFIDSIAVALWTREFSACDSEQQEVVLQRLEGTPHPRVQRFFASLVRATVAGFLCPPEYGGNRDAQGWSYIGYTPHVGSPVTAPTIVPATERIGA